MTLGNLGSPPHLRQTQAFIEVRPIEIIIERTKRVPDGRGGFTLEPAPGSPLPPQRVRKVGSARIGATVERVTSDGKTVIPSSTLIAFPNADIQRYDKFVLEGITHEVVDVSILPEWRLSAEVYEEG